MKLLFTRTFVKNYRELPKRIQNAADKQLEYLLSDLEHPSLNIKKMKDPREIWEGRVADSYRFTFQIEEYQYIMRRIGTHDILKNP